MGGCKGREKNEREKVRRCDRKKIFPFLLIRKLVL